MLKWCLIQTQILFLSIELCVLYVHVEGSCPSIYLFINATTGTCTIVAKSDLYSKSPFIQILLKTVHL